MALAGYLTSRGIPTAPAPAPELKVNLNPLSETWRNIAFAREKPHGLPVHPRHLVVLAVRRAVLAQFPAYGKFVLGAANRR